MNKIDYFTRAESWAADTRGADARSRRLAWTAAGIAAAIAMLEAVALAMLLPLKTVQPVTVLVDRQTGFVQTVDPARPRAIKADEALTQAFLAQYVTARESFDRATIAADYRKVALWSGGRARTSYLAEMPAANPASPFQRYPGGTVIGVRVKSVSRMDNGTALVRFDTRRQDQNGFVDEGQPWVAIIRFQYVNAPMQLEDRFLNPLGFQVTNYRRDAETPPPPAGSSAGMPIPQGTQSTATALSANAVVGSRSVPINQVPLGSPLTSGRTQ